MKPAALAFAAFAAAAVVSGGRASAQTDTTQAPAPVARKTPAKTPAKATPAKPAPKPYVESFPVVHMVAGQVVPGPGKPVTPPAKSATSATKPQATAPTTPAATASKPVAPAVSKPAAPKPAAVATTTVVPKPVTPATAPVAATVPATPATGAINRTVIVLDPAHGGADNGARLSDSILEKDVDLAFAFKLRSLLQARGFTVVLTRDNDSPVQSNDPGAQLTLDNRAGLANHARAAACLLIHATGSGAGVHLYHSELTAASGEAASLPWLTAQAAWVAQSTALAQKMQQALTRGSIPLVSSAASVRPVDSLTCPALVLELAPKESGDASTINDGDYQQTVAEAISGALVFWKNQVQPPLKIQPAAAVDTTTGGQP